MARPIQYRKADGYDVYAKSNGGDYWRIVKACIGENFDQAGMMRSFPALPEPMTIRRDGMEITLRVLAYANPKRLVFRLETEGRTFILKRARMGTAGFKRLFPWAIGLTYFTRIMRLVDKAVRAGCRATQEYFLVAEKRLSFFRHEVWALIEFIEGESLGREEDVSRWNGELRETTEELLRHNLTMDDLTPYNFLVTGGKIKAIDISCRPFSRLQAVKMAMRMNQRYGLDLPIAGIVNNIIRFLLSTRDRLRGARHETQYQ